MSGESLLANDAYLDLLKKAPKPLSEVALPQYAREILNLLWLECLRLG